MLIIMMNNKEIKKMPRGGKRKNAGQKKLKEPRNIYKRLTVKENELIEEMRANEKRTK